MQRNPVAPYEQHGVAFTKTSPSGERSGNCPWCAKRSGSSKRGVGTFCVRGDGELWDCKTCGKNGNLQMFFAEAFLQNWKTPALRPLGDLAKDRGGLRVSTLRAWGVGWGGDGYTYPAWNPSPSDQLLQVTDVRRYRIGRKAFSSSRGHAGLMMPCKRDGGPDFRGSKTIWICEGEWDGAAWWEALRGAGVEDDVVAVPGAGTFPQRCLSLFLGKDVITLYDNDAPGQAGQSHAWEKLGGAASSLRRIQWAHGLVDGFDVRDLYLQEGRDPRKTIAKVKGMLVADDGKAKLGRAAAHPGDEVDPNGKGLAPREVLKQYARWLELDQPELLDVVFGSVMANRMDVDPLWVFVVTPPGGGKSEILMSLSSAPLVHCSTGLTSHTLISGMNVGGQDPSLIPRLIGKTWIVKDFTTVLALNQLARDEIFSVLRDAYDGRIEKPFGNLVIRRYEGRFGIVAGVTSKIDSVTAQNAVLGERFIRFRTRRQGQILEGGKAIMRALDNLTSESRMREDLRETARKVLNRPIGKDVYPKIPLWFKERVVELAHWVASMRGVVERERWTGSTGVISAKPSAEIGTRLAKQFCALGMGIGVYRGLRELDEEVYHIVAGVGRDTCPDRAEEIVRALYACGGEAATKDLAEDTRFPYDTVRWVLQDMALLGVVKLRKGSGGVYVLSEAVATILKRLRLYETDRAWRRAKHG